MTENKATHGIRFGEKIGYALGDAAGTMTLALITPFQLMFYTDVLGISAPKAGVILLIAKIWDAVNDPMWGAFIDSRKPGKNGRFRPYILGASFPLALAAILMFVKLPGLTSTGYLIYALVTFIFYGMMYTGTNIPYGSLASVITDDEIERSSLSMFRSIGAGLGGLPAQILLPLIVYKTNENGVKMLDPGTFLVCVAVLAVLSVGIYYTHYRLTTERVSLPAKQKDTKFNLLKTFKVLLKNPPFMVASLSAMLLIAYQTYTQTCYNYLFKDYFGKPGLYALVTVCTYVPMALFIPFMGKLVAKFGKKEICAAGIGFSAVVNLLMFVLGKTSLAQQPYVFLVLIFFSGAGLTFLVLEIWAIVMDVIDYHELLSGRREEGTCYSIVNFVRKIGQTLAVSGSAFLLGAISYNTENAGLGQPAEVLDKLYNISTIIPAAALVIMFVLLAFCYRFSKNKLAAMREELDKSRA